MKKILVVGGAGYIGGLTTDLLKEKGYQVTVYDNLLYESRYLKDCQFIFGDVRDTKKIIETQKEFDEIIWLAAIVGDGACDQNPKLTKEVNLHSIKRFLRKTKRRIIFTSTCSVYGIRDALVDEESPVRPLSLYAKTKLEAEKYILDNNGLVFRLGTVFGLGDKHSRIRLDLVVNILTLKAFRDKQLTIFGGQQWRPIISVADTAEYLTKACRSDISDIFNIKYKNVQISDLAKEIKKIFPKITIKTKKMTFQDTRNYRVSSKKAERVFEFKPKITVVTEARRMKQVFEEGRIKNFDDNVYYNTHYIKTLRENEKASA